MINYEKIIFEHLILAIKRIIEDVARNSFDIPIIYIGFNKKAKNVIFPLEIESDENTVIVLQDNFLNLRVETEGFYITVEINYKNYNLYIPFNSITLFSMPEEDFIINFEENIVKSLEENEEDEEGTIFIDFSKV